MRDPVRRRPSSKARRAGWLLTAAALAGAALALPGGARPAGGDEDAPRPAQIRRADAETIRTEIQDILSDPRFSRRKTFGEWLMENLRALLRRLGGLELGPGGSWWGTVLFWVFTGWCVLALLAILAHLVWTLAILWRNRRGGGAWLAGPRHYRKAATLSGDQLLERARQLAEQGAFRQALGVMMLALLRSLDELKVLRFHESKTNGDYVREYPHARAGREDFRQFALAFDRTIYTGADCKRFDYRQMELMFEKIRDNVRKEP